MRKLMSMLLALCLVLAMVPVAASAEGNPTITIDGKETTYTDLQTAVSAADEGDTINLPAGTYKLSSVLSIEKAVSLVGDSAGGTIIVGPVQYALRQYRSRILPLNRILLLTRFRAYGSTAFSMVVLLLLLAQM